MGMMKIPPVPDPNDLRICGFAQHEMEVLRAGDGDRNLGRLRLALRRFEQLADDPAAEAARGDAAYEVGRAYDGVGDDANAELWIARALANRAYRESDRWPHHCPSLALRYLWRGDVARAEPLAREAVEQARAGRGLGQDALVLALQTHGEALIGTGRFAEAIAALDEALRLFRASAWMQKFRAGYAVSAMLHLGRANAAMGRTDQALRWFDQAEAESAEWTTRARLDVLLASAEARRAAGRDDEAAERARQAVAWWDAIIHIQRDSGGDVSASERERAALAAAWRL
jgi:tetratricopeptide (TPR) repeat protein